MHRFKSGQLHSGKSKEPVKSRKQALAIALSACGKSKYSEMLQALGYSEAASLAVASFIESQKAADEVEQNSLEADIDATAGKQRPLRKPKQDPQGSIATFPTVPHAEGPMIKAKGGKCPPGTKSVGAGFCKNPKAGNRQYFEVEKGKGCPPGSRTAGKGRCRVDFVEGRMAPQIAENAIKSIQDKPCESKKPKDSTQPKQEVAKPTQPTQPTKPTEAISPERQEIKDAAKKKSEQCAKTQGTQANQFKEMHQSMEAKRRKIKELQSQGHPASILIKQVKDHD
jgi:hypothetical protein